KGLRENVLARMLLHMVEAALPVDFACHFVAPQLPLHEMNDRPILAHEDVGDRPAVQRATVGRLPARRGVEAGAVEDDGNEPVFFDALDDTRAEARLVGVLVIEAITHPGRYALTAGDRRSGSAA